VQKEEKYATGLFVRDLEDALEGGETAGLTQNSADMSPLPPVLPGHIPGRVGKGVEEAFPRGALVVAAGPEFVRLHLFRA